MFDHESFIVIDKGRTHDEKSLVMVENNRYCGYGFIPEQEAILYPSALKNFITYQPDNRDSRQILRSFLRHKRVERIIRIEENM
jgi:DNA polymerase-3 subunit epsilon